MKKTILITIATFAVSLQAQNNFQSSTWMGAADNSRRALRPEGQTGPVTGKPFSGTETRQTKQVLSDGTITNQTSVTKIYRDSDGRTRSESGKNVMLFDAANHVNYTLDSRGCSKQSVHEGDSVVIVATEHGTHLSSSNRTSGSNSGVLTEDLGFQVINGINAQGTRQTITIPAATLGSDHDINVVHEQWYSDSLGILVKSSNNDPRFGSTTYELSNINQSTPDPSLFAPPTGCTEFQMPNLHR